MRIMETSRTSSTISANFRWLAGNLFCKVSSSNDWPRCAQDNVSKLVGFPYVKLLGAIICEDGSANNGGFDLQLA